MDKQKRGTFLLGKAGQMRFEGVQPMALVEDPSANPNLSDEQLDFLKAGIETMVEYAHAGRDLLNGRLAHLKSVAPPHFLNPGSILFVGSAQGAIARFETKRDAPATHAAAWSDESLVDLASATSQNLVHIRLPDAQAIDPLKFGHELTLSVRDPSTNQSRVLTTMRMGIEVEWSGQAPENNPLRPPRLISIRNEIVVEIAGESIPNPGQRPTKFVLKSPIKFNAGWEYIEVFALTEPSAFKPEYAAAWAEADILAAVVAKQFEDAAYQSLDPNSESRRRFGALLAEFKSLLDASPAEERLQIFLRQNPALISPAHVAMWPKLRIGAHVTDFVFREATNDYLLVELEKSSDELFVQTGHPSAKLTHAQGQIADWLRYIQDNLHTVQNELGLEGITGASRCLVVIGRSASLTDENRRKLQVMESLAPRLKIATYDDVLASAKATIENVLGPIWEVPPQTRVYYLPSAE